MCKGSVQLPQKSKLNIKIFFCEERNKEKRKKFISKLKLEDLVFIDESGIEDNEFYTYGLGPRGKRLFADKPGFKIRRVSIIGALNEGKLKAL
jgi:hypothetical protein